MPTTQANIEQVEKSRKKAATLNAQAADYEATAGTLNDTIMDAVHKDRQGRGVSEMATSVGNVMGQLAATPDQMKAYGGDMVNPMDMDVFTSKARASNLRQLGTIATAESENTRTLEDIIQAGANQLVARGQMKMAEAEKLVAEANAMFEKIGFEEDVRQFNESLAEQKRQFDSRAGSGDGSGGGLTVEGLLDMWTRMQGNQGGEGSLMEEAPGDFEPEEKFSFGSLFKDKGAGSLDRFPSELDMGANKLSTLQQAPMGQLGGLNIDLGGAPDSSRMQKALDKLKKKEKK